MPSDAGPPRRAERVAWRCEKTAARGHHVSRNSGASGADGPGMSYPPSVSRPPYVVDPEDPRAPPQDVWDAMSGEERIRVVEELPSEIESAYPPEGDVHRKA